MASSTHDYTKDRRNQFIRININGELFSRDEAMVSVFDSGFILGDGVWEGLRLHNGKIPFLGQHLKRLYEGAKALAIEIPLTEKALAERIYQTLSANDMFTSVHIRLMVTRGMKSTPYQDPAVNIGDATIVIIPEYKEANPDLYSTGVSLFTVHVRRGYADVQDPKLNSHSKINCITACIQAKQAGADEGLMLDPHGFVSTCNSTHFFIIRDGEVWTSTGDYCLGGITRSNVIRLCREHAIPIYEKNFSLMQAYSADEAFVTGTFAGLVPVREIDGRSIGEIKPGSLTEKLRNFYHRLIDTESMDDVE